MNKNVNLGFGIMRLSASEDSAEKNQKILDEYMQGDYCYFDLHPGYISGRAQDIFRECIVKKYPREAYLVANKMPYYNLYTYSDYEKTFQWEKERVRLIIICCMP